MVYNNISPNRRSLSTIYKHMLITIVAGSQNPE